MNPQNHDRAPYRAHDLQDELMHMTAPKGNKAMLIYEDLARERRREAERVARNQRLVRQFSAVKRWERVSAWAARRAQRAAEQF
ncbi:MAG TPA: hypothetical protein VGR06_43675 [Actinophytocola sp.]|jgi:hypothetical protein|uniref:hypothetical protein n=1 Tax=Actinophytocola sp. TaxID=1872138 RepID=UPI002DF8B107|nr:hypothetical protein [Actinophytocola sp.]